MRKERSNKYSRYEILDVTSEIVRDYAREPDIDIDPEIESEPAHVGPTIEASTTTTYRIERPSYARSSPGMEDAFISDNITQNARPHRSPETNRHMYPANYDAYMNTDVVSPMAYRSHESDGTVFSPSNIIAQGTPDSGMTSHSRMTEHAAAHLLSLRNPDQHVPMEMTAHNNTSYPVVGTLPIYDSGMNDVVFDDGIFLPGSTYKELHTTLRNHIFNTARSGAPSRQSSPPYAAGHEGEQNLQQNFVVAATDLLKGNGSCIRSSKAPDLTQQEEYELWKNFIDEVAPWLDKFDNQCHFGRTLPLIAQSHDHLKFSILALSARQLERKDHSRPSSRSLALYQEAIHQLVPELEGRNTAVIASCVVLCVLEMMSCAPKEWRRHLDGCASLIQSVGIHGFSGGIEQALFWCFARMDVCGGLISSEPTLIPAIAWSPKFDSKEIQQLFLKNSQYDMYANYAVYLCAQVLELISNGVAHDKASDLAYQDEWSKIFELVEDWYSNRPLEMKSVLNLPPPLEDYSRPFPILLFSNAPAISGNQLYHSAAILLLQKKPREVVLRRKPRSILSHARRICAISISNTHHGCWTNCVQPLWIAGQIMSHPAEHRAILDTYKRIERETGWGTDWRVKDLQAFWGELDD